MNKNRELGYLSLSTRHDDANHSSSLFSSAFTIVELLVVVVVIAILAVITFVLYSNITKSALSSTMQSSLSTSYRAIMSFQSMNDRLPTSISDCDSSSQTSGYKSSDTTTLCIKPASTFTYTYTYDNNSNPQTFTLYAISNDKTISYKVSSSNSSPIASTKTCPNNFILVPGSTTYGTSDFCVSKYEMKIYGNDNGAQTYSSTNLPNSRPGGTPYVNISQTNAISQASKTVDAQGNTIPNTHLITEAEWMTIAQNVLSQSSNWSGGTIGTGFIYNGHVGNNPASGLAADANDANGNYGETTYNNSNVNVNNDRTLALSNGETIWDLSGNVYEWTQGQTTGNQLGLSSDSAYVWREWKNATSQNGFPTGSMPSSMASGSLANITSWTTGNGIGGLYSNYNDTSLRGFLRGGNWGAGSGAGVLFLTLDNAPGNTSTAAGFRVVSSGV